MLSLCGCYSRRRAKKSSTQYIEDAAPKIKACPGPTETMARSTVNSIGESRLSLDDFGVQTSDIPKRKSSNALETVKEKLIRHLSNDKDAPQKPQASPDGDKDEIARRAELRRFRARRIQEELNQDRNKSISTHTSIRSTRYLSPLIDIGRPGHGPRDAIEFSIDSGSHLPAPYPSPVPSMASFKAKSPNMSMKRWSSCPAAIGQQSGKVNTPLYNNPNTALSRKRYTAPGKLPASKSMPNLILPKMRAPQLARTKTATFGSDIHTTLDVWLALQESRARASPILSVADPRLPSPGSLRHQNTLANKRLTEFSQETVTIPYPIRQSGTSRLPSVSKSARQWGSQATTSSKPSSGNRSRHSLGVPSDGKKYVPSNPDQGRIVPSETHGGISSSYYPSVMPSIQPSPSRSNSLVNVLTLRDLQSLELSPFEWHDDNSILRSFGTSGEDHSSYATAEGGENDSQDSPRISNESAKRGHDGQADEKQSSHRRFRNTLGIHKRRENSRSDSTVNDSGYRGSNKNIRPRTERAGLPTIWRSGSGSWDVKPSLPKRISSKLWYQYRTASATIPEVNTSISVCNERGESDDVGIPTIGGVRAGEYREEIRATLRKSKVDTSNEVRRNRAHGTSKILGNQSTEPSFLSHNSVAYNALQKVSQRHASAPPLSWARYQSRKQDQNSANLTGSGPKAISVSDGQIPGKTNPHVLAENRNVRSISFPSKMGDLVETVLTKIMPSRKSSESFRHPSPEPAPSKVLPLEPLSIDEVQTSPVLGEIELF